MISHPKELNDKSLTAIYRWNGERWEYWADRWCPSTEFQNRTWSNRDYIKSFVKVVSYNSTWCEPFEGMED